MFYNKLIRDRIPHYIQNKKFTIREARKEELFGYIIRKVREELGEFIANPSLEEAADVAEIIDKLFKTTIEHTMSDDEFHQARAKKKAAKGAFDEDLILIEVEDENVVKESKEK